MLTDKTIGFLGCGNLAEALIRGFISSGEVSAGRIIASDKFGPRLLEVAEAHEIKVFNKNIEVAGASDIIFLTVKPQDVPAVIAEIAGTLSEGTGGAGGAVGAGDEKLIISVAAGVATGTILELLRDGGLKRLLPVIRAMPNTPVIVREGATALYPASGVGEKEIEAARRLFEAVGRVVLIEDESLMDAVTGLSGSGPAYVFLILEALVEAGVKEGLSKETAKTLAVQTVLGGARLAMESDKELKELREMVTSPGGTTVEGLASLEQGGLRQTLRAAVAAAAKRSKELSGS